MSNQNQVHDVDQLERELEELAASGKKNDAQQSARNLDDSATAQPGPNDKLGELAALIAHSPDGDVPIFQEKERTMEPLREGLLTQNLLKNDEMLEKIIKAHKLNDLEDSQVDHAKDYMDKIAYHVPLDQLYQIIASCQFQEGSPFCPVLIKIIDQKIIQESGGKPFLMQVWSNQGEMIFEKPLQEPPVNWNIVEDKFMWLEQEDAKQIYLVKLFIDKKPILFKFKLPDDLEHELTNKNIDHDAGNFMIEENKKQDDGQSEEQAFTPLKGKGSDHQVDLKKRRFYMTQNLEKEEDIDHMLKLGEIRKQDYDMSYDIQEKSVSQCLKQKQTELIIRAPDKMISFFCNYIIIAYHNNIFQFNISKANVDEQKSSDTTIVTEITNEQIRVLDVSDNFRIVAIQPLMSQTTIVLEDKKTFQMRFMKIKLNESKNKLWFIQLGLLANESFLTKSPLLKFRGLSALSENSGKRYHIGVVLRLNGRFEVYYDYILVNEYYNNQLQCVDVATDFNKFYFKFVKDSHLVTDMIDESELEYEVRSVPHFWRNLVGFNTSKRTNTSTWDIVIHRRISQYFKLYSQIQIFNMYVLVSHRNMISVFCMTKSDNDNSDLQNKYSLRRSRTGKSKEEEEAKMNGQWIQTIAFDEGYIRKIFIKKRAKTERIKQRAVNETLASTQSVSSGKTGITVFQKFIITAIIGTHTFQYINFDHNGMLTPTDKKLQAPGRIIRFVDDTQHRNGTMILTDDVKDTEDYKEHEEGSLLYTYPLNTENSNQKVSVHVLKFGKFHELISSGTEVGKCCHYDSQLGVIKANKDFFQNLEGDSEDEIEKHVNQEKDQINVLVCRSDKNNTTSLFPLLKERETDSKLIKGMRLIQKNKNRKTIPHEDQDSSELLESFFVTYESFGENQNNYCTVTEKYIKIYDSEMNLKLKFEGLNIRASQQMHQGQLYTISDDIQNPPLITKYYGEDAGEPQPQKNFSFQSSGFFVYDIPQLFRGIVEVYRLAGSIGGQSSLVSKSKFGNRFTFLQSYLDIMVIPVPHLNLIECIGMGQKSDYLVWREKNGFFTALDRYGNLRTWSLVSGKMIYQEKQMLDGSRKNTKFYEVYTADENDLTYTQNFYNLRNSSLTLLKSKSVVTKPILQEQDLNFNEPLLDRMLAKGQLRNKDGNVKAMKTVQQLGKSLFQARDSQIDIRVKNSLQQSDLYHFKVLELKVHEDTQDLSECKVRFHFYFELLRQKTRENLASFEWDITSNPRQYLYLSRDTTRLMEVINNYTATIYYRGNINKEGKVIDDRDLLKDDPDDAGQIDCGQQVKWKEEFRILRFPRFTDQTSVPVLFSPNFTYQLDVDFRNKQFVILKSDTRHIYMNIPNDLLSTHWGFLNEQDAVKLICSRFKWVSEKVFRIINQSNVDCLFEMQTSDPFDNDQAQRSLKLLSQVKVDNLHENQNQLDSAHLFVQRKEVEDRNVTERLIRANQEYKTSLMHAINTKQPNYKLMSKINKINYSRPWTSENGKFDIELTFTWIDWRIIDLIINPEIDVDLPDMDKDQRIQLCFDIFPKGRGALHQIALWAQAIDTYSSAHELFAVTSEEKEYDITGAEGEISFEVPILPDIYGQTPLDICLNLTKDADPFKFIEQIPEKELAGRSQNYAMADEIFRGIKEYGYNHSSQFITKALTYGISENIPSTLEYLDSRLKDAEDVLRDNRTQSQAFKDQLLECNAMGQYSSAPSSLWQPDSIIQNKLFDPQAQLISYNVQFLDLPQIFRPSEEAYAFIDALISPGVDLSIFELPSVQIIIDHHSHFWRRYNLLGIGLPMFIQLLLYIVWSNVFVIGLLAGSNAFDEANDAVTVLLTITAIYLFLIEVYAIYRAGLSYLKNATRLLNLITPTLIMINVHNISAISETYWWTIQCWAGICIWLRFFLFLGTLETFSWLVRLIIRSFSDMLTFLLIFIIGIFAFSDADLSIHKILELRGILDPRELSVDADFYEKYLSDYVEAIKTSFLTGALAIENGNLMEYRNIDWLVFFLCVLFNIIVMLNTLIAIVGQTFSEMRDAIVAEGYKEKAVQVGILQDSLFGFFLRQGNQNSSELLTIFTPLSETTAEEEEGENLKEQVESLHEKFDAMQEDLKFIKENMSKAIESLDKK